jgi:hypothetical protein
MARSWQQVSEELKEGHVRSFTGKVVTKTSWLKILSKS